MEDGIMYGFIKLFCEVAKPLRRNFWKHENLISNLILQILISLYVKSKLIEW